MPNIYERALSRSFVLDQATGSLPREFVVTGTLDEAEVVELTLLAASVVWSGLVRKSIKAEPQGGGVWYVTVEYANIDVQQAIGEPPEPPEGPGGGVEGGDAPLPSSVTWDTTGGTVRVTQSLKTISKTNTLGVTTLGAVGDPGGDFTLDNKRAIGLSTDRVEGCDKVAPSFKWSIEVPRSVCTLAYMTSVRACTGCVNYTAPFYGFAAGEVLYLGASARPGSTSRWSITHNFAVQKNQVNVVIGNGITVPTKKGWDYIWVAYSEKDRIGNMVIPVPGAAYVERVYESANFDILEIGR